MADDKMLARIAALLRQAEGTDNAHEAEAFMAAAQRLATATAIDLAVARSHSAQRTAAQLPVQRTVTIGEAGTRGLRTYVQLFVGIAGANDVRCDVASNSTFVYAYGFAEDIDATHALYSSLVLQMVRASEAYIASGAHRPTPTRHWFGPCCRGADCRARLRGGGRPCAGRTPATLPGWRRLGRRRARRQKWQRKRSWQMQTQSRSFGSSR